MKKWIASLSAVAAVVGFTSLVFVGTGSATQSVCYGTTSNGYLVDGVKLPVQGENFVSYSFAAIAAGRTFVHSDVRDIMVTAWDALAQSHPDKVYKYAEMGFADGGQFRPHKTHRNGLSIDMMTPMINAEGESVHLPTTPFNKLGYNIELDDQGRYEDLRIDYEALAAHIVELHKAATAQGHDIWRVIFDPELQAPLFETQYGSYLRRHIQFSTRRSWVRHDEHYHIDFAIPCQ
uniref:penicillin-insensitive murein endopeptidase n=1 Tax=Thaumasiovibrio occultus TaxID=1891184 RepID=UPI000B35921C|nr:penicillin-insensitive murein endopeptidase [Thaumasiovibrio occultus]